MVNEMRLLNKLKSDLYELRVEMMGEEVTSDMKAQGEECIDKISCLRTCMIVVFPKA